MKKNVLNKGINFITNPNYRFNVMTNYGVFNKMSDREYLEKAYEANMGYRLDLENPKTFNEKLQWLKLYNRNPQYTIMVDKYLVKNYVANIIGKQYIIPTLGVWNSPDEIDFNALPDKFVLKCNHNSGTGMYICKDKSKMNIVKVKRNLRKGLKEDYYIKFREWPYKNVPRKILCEEYIEESSTHDLNDYKFFCFDGKVDCVMVCKDRSTEAKFYFFNRKWELLRCNKRGLEAPENFTLNKPCHLDEMFELAEKLSKGLPFARIDLFDISIEHPYFGEITFFPDSGFDKNITKEADCYWGKKLKLPLKRKV